ncbi:MAG TPA: porin [Polyangiaceae bacterium]
MKFPVILLTPSLTFFAFNALAQDVPAPAAPTTGAATAQTAPAAPAPVPTLPPAAAAPTAIPELVPPLPPPSSAAVGNDGNPMAGWHNGVFYLRDTSDNFRLYLQGRAQVDFYSYAGPGVADSTLKPTLFLRRIRPEIGGEFFHSWWFSIAGDFGVTKNDNGSGTNETSAARPTVTPDATTARYASAQTAAVSAAPTDVFLNYRAHPLFNVQVGQYDAPFTMENRTSDKYIPFMERSLAVRDVGIPTNKDIGAMFWGEDPSKYFFYSAGLFNGEGQNRLNTDSRGDIMARAFVHPLAGNKDALKDLQIGASFRYGSRDSKYTYYDYPGMSTQGGYTFWTTNYTASDTTHTHILPSGNQTGVAGELRIPFDAFDLTSEFVYIENHTREVTEGLQATPGSLRRGDLHGYSYYIQAGYWIGKRDVNGLPGYENMTHVDFSKADPETPPTAVQVLAKWEQLHLNYAGASRAGTPDTTNADGDIKVNAFSLGLNYWATKHIRLSANYVLNMFPSSEPVSATTMTSPAQSSKNRALAPANGLGKGVNNDARDNGHTLNEFLLRCAVAL